MARDHILGWHEKLTSPGSPKKAVPFNLELFNPLFEGRVFETVDHSLPSQIEEEELADNLQLKSDGSYSALCSCCDQWGPLYFDITELTHGQRTGKTTYKHYCGGSPRCCP
jgi:hypothetical protein